MNIKLLVIALGILFPASNAKANLKGMFISIDGLNPNYVKTMDQENLLEKKGFSWLLKDSIYSHNSKPVITTLTAPSHISTITCTPPSRHGIVGNGFIKNGKSKVGFTSEFSSEPFWISAQRQGLKVLAIAYVGADGSSKNRSATWGIAYPHRKYTSKHQIIDIKNQGTQKVNLLLNPLTKESKEIFVYKSKKGIVFDTNQMEKDGFLGIISNNNVAKFYFKEQTKSSDLYGYKRSFFAMQLPEENKIYISGSSYNNAYPKSFRTMLDDANLVWLDYGLKIKAPLSYKIKALSEIDHFSTEVFLLANKNLKPDVALFYQPLIDSIGHKHQGQLPSPFNPKNNDEYTKGFIKAYQAIDHNLHRIFSNLPKSTTVALMGDHGMDPIKKSVNLLGILNKEEKIKIKIKTSGSIAFIHALDKKASPKVVMKIKQALDANKVNGESVYSHFLSKSDYPNTPQKDYTKEWQYGDAQWVFINSSGFWFKNNRRKKELILPPPTTGMHGHSVDLKNMATGFYIKGPSIKKGKMLSEFHLINAIPTFSEALGIEAPKDCLGKSIL